MPQQDVISSFLQQALVRSFAFLSQLMTEPKCLQFINHNSCLFTSKQAIDAICPEPRTYLLLPGALDSKHISPAPGIYRPGPSSNRSRPGKCHLQQCGNQLCCLLDDTFAIVFIWIKWLNAANRLILSCVVTITIVFFTEVFLSLHRHSMLSKH